MALTRFDEGDRESRSRPLACCSRRAGVSHFNPCDYGHVRSARSPRPPPCFDAARSLALGIFDVAVECPTSAGADYRRARGAGLPSISRCLDAARVESGTSEVVPLTCPLTSAAGCVDVVQLWIARSRRASVRSGPAPMPIECLTQPPPTSRPRRTSSTHPTKASNPLRSHATKSQ